MNSKISGDKISGISTTLLIPLWARVAETQSIDPIIKDYYAIKIKEQIDFNFSLLDNMNPTRKKIFQRGIAVRTRIIDDEVKTFLSNNPDGLIINMGCGLDTRFFRLDNGQVCWIDVDVAEAIDFKKNFFSESDRYKLLAASILDAEWLNNIIRKKDQAMMIISEGTLFYFQLYDVKMLIDRLVDRFPGAQFLFEVIGSWHQGKVHPSLRSLGLEIIFPWGIKEYKSIETWNKNLKVIKSMNLFDYYRNRLSKPLRIFTFLWPGLKNRLSSAIVHICVEK